MGFTAERIDVPCYIGETRFKAGIFLSKQIAGRKKYAERLKLVKFASYKEAREAFLGMYGERTGGDIRLNRLYEVRSQEVYSVVSTLYYAGVYETDLKWLAYQGLGFKDSQNVVCWDYLSYEKAIKFARGCFARIWRDPRLYIYQYIPLNKAISLEDVRRKNGIY